MRLIHKEGDIMKQEVKCNFHNRFDIEVRDKDTGELKQKGVAENMILNRAYNRICNFNSYFNYIHFGSGTGTLDPSRTTLFTPLGNRTATVDEIIKEYPVSKVTKKIILNPEEYVGQTITEVGISEVTNAINTHALIKDAEGNPLSITKTDIDVITIYATVFIELQDANDVTFSKFATNSLVNYFTDGSAMNPSLLLGDIGEATTMNTIGYRRSSHSLTRLSDVPNRKVSFSTRLDIHTANYDIREIALDDICRVGLEDSMIWSPYTLAGIFIGNGDGEKTAFDLERYDLSDVVIKVDGNITNEYVLEGISGDNRKEFPLWKLVDTTSTEEIDTNIYKGFSANLGDSTGGAGTPLRERERVIPVNSDMVAGIGLEGAMRGYFSLSSSTGMGLTIEGSYDGETYENIDTWTVGNTSTPEIRQCTIDNPYNYLKFTWYRKNPTADHVVGTIDYIKCIKQEYKTPQVVFTTPPPVGSVITADYTVPYIPKTEEYVLDVEFTLQFGERV